MLDDSKLKTFLTLVSEGSFTLAAARLGVTQPSVSQTISEIERVLGTKLIDRQKGELLLTPAGHIFKKYAEQITGEYATLALLFEKVEETEVRVSASEDVFVYVETMLLRDFLKVHPEVRLIRTETEQAHIFIRLVPVAAKPGILSLYSYPSQDFAGTRLWGCLAHLLAPSAL